MKSNGHTLLITGGASGIGLAMARQFIQAGNTVIITGRNTDKLRLAQAELPELHTVPGDLSKSEDLDRLVHYIEQHHPTLNVLINNASVQYNYHFGSEVSAVSKADYEIRTNLMAPIKLVAMLLPVLRANTDPAIVNVSSSLGFVPKASAAVYAATKAGIHIFSKALRYQLTDVRVFEVIPPLVDTPMTTGRGRGKISADMLVDKFMRGWRANRLEIRVGRAKLLLALHRWLPGIAERMLRDS